MKSALNFQNKRVFVTGHTGFKGSWLSIWLAKLGADVYGYSLHSPTVPSNYTASGVSSLLEDETIGDIRNASLLEDALLHADPDVIFHLAAQPLVRHSYDHPAETFETNIMGTVNVLEAVRHLDHPVTVIMVTSDKCYQNTGQVWGYRECDKVGGSDPYSASKGATELVISSYTHSFFAPEKIDEHGVKIASVRAGNVIGGGDWAEDRIIPDAVRAAAKGEPVTLRSPEAVRPWQHVLEPLAGYMVLAERMMASNESELCSGWNFGPYPQDICTVYELVQRFYAECGDGSIEFSSGATGKPESGFLKLSIDKAMHHLGWHPHWDLSVAVKRTALWYSGFYDNQGSNALDLCHADIDAYVAAVP